MPKVKYEEYSNRGYVYDRHYKYWCAGCKRFHYINPDVHQFNGDVDKPTFKPSLLMNWNVEEICHSFMTDGNIQYLDDCWHELKGQTIEVPDVEEMIALHEKKSTNE